MTIYLHFILFSFAIGHFFYWQDLPAAAVLFVCGTMLIFAAIFEKDRS